MLDERQRLPSQPSAPDVLQDGGRRDIRLGPGSGKTAEPRGGFKGPKPVQRQVSGNHDTLVFQRSATNPFDPVTSKIYPAFGEIVLRIVKH
ncbi:hypothetical protein J2Z19_002816 [Ensifer adhaerens]|uniref:Uncharacterized protein n=1 Tax=Ensifer adhaerens TaxID=106592 RepID=A0ACC5SXI7_ENSAD|nr:hypothetical protein [Ensifer adhaerens]